MPTKSILVLVSVVASAATVVSSPLGADAQPRPTPPTIASVTAQLNKLADRAESLAEKFNAAQLEMQRQQTMVTLAQRHATDATSEFQAARRDVAPIAVAEYESGAFSQTGAILTSDNSQSYLNSLATRNMMNLHLAAVIARLDTARRQSQQADAAAKVLLAKATSKRDDLANKRTEVAAQTARFQRVLSTLTASQRQAYTTMNAPSPAQISALYRVHAGNAAAQRAITFAIAQVGKPYVWAAAGPDSFDCSGLTMAAWAAGGVALPHLASAQYNYGTHVGYNNLQPGDLVFMYSDIHHVEIYVGNGLAVSAPQPGENVKFVRVANSLPDFYGATRLT